MKYDAVSLHGIIEIILDPLITAISWVFQKIVSNLFGWLLEILYQIVIYLPLQIINSISIVFRFFCGMFTNYIFGNGQPILDISTGKVNLAFDLNSGLGQIVSFTLIISLLLFFILWILTFSGSTMGSNGRPIKGMGERFKLLKWPFLMIMSVFILPYFLVLADGLMSNLLLWMNGSEGYPASEKELLDILGYSLPNFQSITEVGTKCYIPKADMDFNTFFETFESRLNHLQTFLDSASGNEVPKGYFLDMVNKLVETVGKIRAYALETSYMDYQGVANILHSNQLSGGYLTSEQVKIVANAQKHLTDFHDQLDEVCNSYYNIFTGPETNDSWNMIESAAKNYPSFQDIKRTEYITALSNLHDSWINVSTSKVSLYQFMNSSGSYYQQTLEPADKRISWTELQYHTKGLQPFEMSGIIYMLATGDSNPNNWTKPSNPDFISRGEIIRWIIGAFLCWSMILICYTYCHSSVSRTYFIISYWVVGIVYLANGISQSKAAQSWYKQIFSKWWSVIVISICFEMSCFFVNAIIPIFQGQSTLTGKLSIGGIDILPLLGGVFALEAGFQVGYLIYTKYIESIGGGAGGVGSASGAYTSPTSFLSSGAALMASTTESAKNWTNTLTGANAVRSVMGLGKTLSDARDKRDSKLSSNIAQYEAMANIKQRREDMAAKGYQFRATTSIGGGPLIRKIKDGLLLKKGSKNGELSFLGRLFDARPLGVVDESYKPWDNFERRNADGSGLEKGHTIGDMPNGGILAMPKDKKIPGPLDVTYGESVDMISEISGTIKSNGRMGMGPDAFMETIFGKNWKEAINALMREEGIKEDDITLAAINRFRQRANGYFRQNNPGENRALNDKQVKMLMIYNELATRNNAKEDVKLKKDARVKLMKSNDPSDVALFGKLYAFKALRTENAPADGIPKAPTRAQEAPAAGPRGNDQPPLEPLAPGLPRAVGGPVPAPGGAAPAPGGRRRANSLRPGARPPGRP